MSFKTSHHNCFEYSWTFLKIVTSLTGCLVKTFVARISYFHSGSIIDIFEFPLAINIFSMAMFLELQIVNKHIPRLLMSTYSGEWCSIKFNQKISIFSNDRASDRKITCKIKTLKQFISDTPYPANFTPLFVRYVIDFLLFFRWSIFKFFFNIHF